MAGALLDVRLKEMSLTEITVLEDTASASFSLVRLKSVCKQGTQNKNERIASLICRALLTYTGVIKQHQKMDEKSR